MRAKFKSKIILNTTVRSGLEVLVCPKPRGNDGGTIGVSLSRVRNSREISIDSTSAIIVPITKTNLRSDFRHGQRNRKSLRGYCVAEKIPKDPVDDAFGWTDGIRPNSVRYVCGRRKTTTNPFN